MCRVSVTAGSASRGRACGSASRIASTHSSPATPARFAITIFAALVLLFTGLFSLPIATTSGQQAPLVDALFTAVSVICVTGLSTVDMATFWSPLGHVFVFVGVEIGGVGVLTVASILGLVIARRLGLRQKLLAAGDANPLRIRKGPIAESQAVRLGETGGLLITVAISVLVIEAIVAVALFPRMLHRRRTDPGCGVAVGVPLGDGVHQHRLPADGRGADPVCERRLLPDRDDDRASSSARSGSR